MPSWWIRLQGKAFAPTMALLSGQDAGMVETMRRPWRSGGIDARLQAEYSPAGVRGQATSSKEYFSPLKIGVMVTCLLSRHECRPGCWPSPGPGRCGSGRRGDFEPGVLATMPEIKLPNSSGVV
jgi:hypothetical protein